MTNLTCLNRSRLRAKRLEMGLSQEALAELAGLHRNSIANLEGGKGARMETIVRVAEAMAVPLSTFFDLAPSATANGVVHAS